MSGVKSVDIEPSCSAKLQDKSPRLARSVAREIDPDQDDAVGSASGAAPTREDPGPIQPAGSQARTREFREAPVDKKQCLGRLAEHVSEEHSASEGVSRVVFEAGRCGVEFDWAWKNEPAVKKYEDHLWPVGTVGQQAPQSCSPPPLEPLQSSRQQPVADEARDRLSGRVDDLNGDPCFIWQPKRYPRNLFWAAARWREPLIDCGVCYQRVTELSALGDEEGERRAGQDRCDKGDRKGDRKQP
jgi:hypothetical protein